MDKQILIETLRGQARANEVVEAERFQRLANMTQEEARRIAQDLQGSWEASRHSQKGLERLELWRIDGLLTVRRAFETMARAKGLI